MAVVAVAAVGVAAVAAVSIPPLFSVERDESDLIPIERTGIPPLLVFKATNQTSSLQSLLIHAACSVFRIKMHSLNRCLPAFT